ncbi:helix-turn-helix transcriptional regulator [Saccharothrix sp. S26]|jgi:DNA-binding CsgD family transcriptional regulator|uniref:response regulator transcription factor n=1 Tax=Saccharothrix sp. S26 TaxID=2907215 RepID=UPI001F1A7D8A|nr:helix-turn-helix transcriptional regulator [Saccharothrix sp. S26]MCE6996398.1 helix-turn-helix transcriptional regulator [Saccharothrix sp. S26]
MSNTLEPITLDRADGGGWTSLTPAEARVATLVVQGLTNRAVARRLAISPHTVDTHLRRVFGKLRVRSRVELTRAVLSRDHAAPARVDA